MNTKKTNPPQHSFTILIPAYNSANWISKAIDSVLINQYDPNLFEIVVVNDGSKDNTADIVMQYCKRYNNIKLFSKPNGNWGSVINYAKENHLIKNDYVFVLDSDDVMSKNFFKMVNKKIKDADILMCSIFVKIKNTKFYAQPYYCFSKKIKKFENRFSLCYAPISVVYKSSIFYQTIKLLDDLPYQDILLTYHALSICKKVRWTNKVSGTYWKTRPGNSTCAPWDEKRMKQEILLHEQISKINLETMLAHKILIKGFRQQAKKDNYKILMRSQASSKQLPWFFRWLFWGYYLFLFRKYIKYI